MKQLIVVPLLLAACGSKKEAAPKAEDKPAEAEPTSGSCWMPDKQTCYEFTAEDVKASGAAAMKAMCRSQYTLAANKPCPTENLLGTCRSGTTQIKYYSGEQDPSGCSACPAGHGAVFTKESAAKDCSSIGAGYTFQ